jgi:hypothetical protein
MREQQGELLHYGNHLIHARLTESEDLDEGHLRVLWIASEVLQQGVSPDLHSMRPIARIDVGARLRDISKAILSPLTHRLQSTVPAVVEALIEPIGGASGLFHYLSSRQVLAASMRGYA